MSDQPTEQPRSLANAYSDDGIRPRTSPDRMACTGSVSRSVGTLGPDGTWSRVSGKGKVNSQLRLEEIAGTRARRRA